MVGEQGFVTIHDYISTIHPWLLPLKADIVRSNHLWDRVLEVMVVQLGTLDMLVMDEKAEWERRYKPVARGP